MWALSFSTVLGWPPALVPCIAREIQSACGYLPAVHGTFVELSTLELLPCMLTTLLYLSITPDSTWGKLSVLCCEPRRWLSCSVHEPQQSSPATRGSGCIQRIRDP